MTRWIAGSVLALILAFSAGVHANDERPYTSVAQAEWARVKSGIDMRGAAVEAAQLRLVTAEARSLRRLLGRLASRKEMRANATALHNLEGKLWQIYETSHAGDLSQASWQVASLKREVARLDRGIAPEGTLPCEPSCTCGCREVT